MDVINWKRILLHWIKRTGFVELSAYDLEHIDVEEFYKKFREKISVVKIEQSTLLSFLKKYYKEFEPHFDDGDQLSSIDYIYVYSLLLEFSCIKFPEKFFHEICQQLPEVYQQSIAIFFNILLHRKEFTKESIRHAIAESSPKVSLPYLAIDSPSDTPQKLSPKHPERDILDDKLREINSLRAQLETEKYEKGFLEVQVKQLEEKIKKTNQNERKLQTEVQKLRNDVLSSDIENLAPNKNLNDEQSRKKYLKAIEGMEDIIIDLKDQISSLGEGKALLTEKLTYSQKQVMACMEKINVLENGISASETEIKQKDFQILTLTESNNELKQFLNEVRSGSGKFDPNSSTEWLDSSFRLSSSSSNIGSPENLARSVVDIQLREKLIEIAELQEQIEQMLSDQKKLSKHICEIMVDNAKVFEICHENLLVNPDSDAAHCFVVFQTYLEKLLNRHQAMQVDAQKMGDRVNDLNAKNEELSKIIDDRNDSISDIENKLSALQNEIEQSKIERNCAEKTNQKYLKEIEVMLKDISVLNKNLEEKKINLKSLELLQQEILKQNEEKSLKVSEIEIENLALQRNLEELNNRLCEMEKENSELKASTDELKQENFTLATEKQEQEIAISKIGLQLIKSVQESEYLKLQCDEFSAKHEKCVKELKDVQIECDAKTNLVINYEQKIALISDARNELAEQVTELKLIEVSMHKKVENLSEDVKSLKTINVLKEQQYQQLQTDFNERIAKIQATAEQLQKECNEKKIIVEEDLKIHKARLQHATHSIEELSQQLNVLKMDNDTITRSLSAKESRNQALLTELSEFKASEEDLKQKLSKLNCEKLQLTEKIAEIHIEQELLVGEISKIHQFLKDRKEDAFEFVKLKDLEKQLNRILTEKSDLQLNNFDLNKRILELVETLSQKENTIQLLTTDLQKTLDNSINLIKNLQNELEASTVDTIKLRSVNSEQEIEKKELIANLKTNDTESQKKLTDYSRQMEMLLKDKQNLEERNANFNCNEKKLKELIARLENEAGKCASELWSLKTESEILVKKLKANEVSLQHSEKALKELQESSDKLQISFTAEISKNDILVSDIANLKNTVNKMETEKLVIIEMFTKNNDRLDRERLRHMEDLSELKRSFVEIDKSRKLYKTQSEESDTRNLELLKKIDDLEATRQESEERLRGNFDTIVLALTEEKDILELQLKEKDERVAELSNLLHDFKKRCQAEKKDISLEMDNLREKLVNINAVVQLLEEEKKNAVNNVEAFSRKINENLEEIENFKKEIQNVKCSLSAKEDYISSLEQENVCLNLRIEELNEKLVEIEQQQLLNAAKMKEDVEIQNELKSRMEEILEKNRFLENDIASLKNISNTHQNEVEKNCDLLKENQDLKLQIVSSERKISGLQMSLQIAEDQASKLEDKCKLEIQRVIESKDAELLTEKQFLTAMKKDFETLELKIKEASLANEKLLKLKRKSEDDYETTTKRLEKTAIELGMTQARVLQFEKLNVELEKNHKTILQKDAKLQTDIKNLNSKLEEIGKMNKNLTEENSKLLQSQEIFKSLELKNSSLQESVTKFEAALNEMSEQLKLSRTHNDTLSKENTELEHNLNKLKTECEIINRNSASKQEEIMQNLIDYKTENDSLRAENCRFAEQLQKLEEWNPKYGEEIGKKSCDIKQNEILSTVETRDTQLLEQIKEIETRYKNLETIYKEEKSITEQLRKDKTVFHAKLNYERRTNKENGTKYSEEIQRIMKETGEKIKENRRDLEQKLDKMKAKMDTQRILHSDEMNKLKAKHTNDVSQHSVQIQKLSQKLHEQNVKILQLEKENALLDVKLKSSERMRSTTSHPIRNPVGSSKTFGPASDLRMEDEPGEVFNNTYLTDMKTDIIPKIGRDSVAIEELQHRNSMLPLHMRSTYRAQYGDQELREQDIIDIPVQSNLDDSSSSLIPAGHRKKIGTGTSYRRPGPPTPSKNAGRLSFGGGEIQREVLKESYEGNSKKPTTPGKFTKMFSSSSTLFSSSRLKDETPEWSIESKSLRRNGKSSIRLSITPFSSTPRKSKTHYDHRRILSMLLNSSKTFKQTEVTSIHTTCLQSDMHIMNPFDSAKFLKWRQTDDRFSTDSCTTSDSNSVHNHSGRKGTEKSENRAHRSIRSAKERRCSIYSRGKIIPKSKLPISLMREQNRKRSKSDRSANFNKFRKTLTLETCDRRYASICESIHEPKDPSGSWKHNSSECAEELQSTLIFSTPQNIEICGDFERLLTEKESSIPFEICENNVNATSSTAAGDLQVSNCSSSRTLYAGNTIFNRKIPHSNATVIRKSSIYRTANGGEIFTVHENLTELQILRMLYQNYKLLTIFLVFWIAFTLFSIIEFFQR